MALPNHNLAAGDLILYEGKLNRRSVMFQPSVMFQIQYSGIEATTVKIQVSFRVNSEFDWVVDPACELIINPALTSDFIRIANAGFEEVQLKLVTGGVIVGVVHKVGKI